MTGVAGGAPFCSSVVRPADHNHPMICQMTGNPHRLFWMRSAWWCADCRQKIESCCEGGGCPSVAEVQTVANKDE